MSHYLTPPEPVAWDSRHPAETLNSVALPCLYWLKLWFKAFVCCHLWLVTRRVIVTLGWLRPRLVSFYPLDNKNRPSWLTLLNSCQTIKSRVGISYSHKFYKTFLFLTFNLTLIFTSPQIVTAKGDTVTSLIPTRLIIPRIALDSAIVPVGLQKVEKDGQTYNQWQVDDNLVGWHNLSAPLGRVGNSVLNGHSNVHTQIFRNLDKVDLGDRIIAFADDQTYVYVVVRKILVQEKDVPVEKRIENAKLIMPTTDERLTLVTCAQPGATHRLIVIAYPEHSYSK